MGRELGCREEREVGGDGWVDGRIRGIARQAFRTRLSRTWLPQGALHTCRHTSMYAHTQYVYTRLLYMTKINSKKAAPFLRFPSQQTLAFIHFS